MLSRSVHLAGSLQAGRGGVPHVEKSRHGRLSHKRLPPSSLQSFCVAQSHVGGAQIVSYSGMDGELFREHSQGFSCCGQHFPVFFFALQGCAPIHIGARALRTLGLRQRC
jgi:hypothetical protein